MHLGLEASWGYVRHHSDISRLSSRFGVSAKPCTNLYIPRPEEELSVEVGLLNDVHVGDGDLALGARGQPQHREALEEFTANSTGTHLSHNTTQGAWCQASKYGTRYRAPGPAETANTLGPVIIYPPPKCL